MKPGDPVVVDAVRTPRGKGSARGALHAIAPLELVTGLLDALTARGLPSATVDDVVLGCASQTGEQGGNLARTAVLRAGWDVAVGGVTINRFCASGLDAINLAAARIRAGDATTIVAGGVESVSRAPLFADGGPLWREPYSIHMGIAADVVATLEGFERDQLDGYALATRARARRGAVDTIIATAGLVDDELRGWAPSAAAVAAMAPAFTDLGAGGQDAIALAHLPALARVGQVRHLHTRASSPALADAAALVVVVDRATAEGRGLRPRARIVASVSCAADPVLMLTAGQDAVVRLLDRAGLRAADIDVFEFAEAFAALCLRFARDLDVGPDRLNPRGGTIALGHAFGATGAILLGNLVAHLEERQGRYGICAVSGAAGLGVATLVERL